MHVVSDRVLNDVGIRRLNHLSKGTDSNGGQPGTFEITFQSAGCFVFYCRFHSHLDDATGRRRPARAAASRTAPGASARP